MSVWCLENASLLARSRQHPVALNGQEFVRVKVFKANISVISWQSVLLLEETGVPIENH